MPMHKASTFFKQACSPGQRVEMPQNIALDFLEKQKFNSLIKNRRLLCAAHEMDHIVDQLFTAQ